MDITKSMIKTASQEEQEFADLVNAKLTNGAKVQPYTRHEGDGAETVVYCMLYWMGPKRLTVSSNHPFHYDSVDDVVKRVNYWVEHVNMSRRWSTELPVED